MGYQPLNRIWCHSIARCQSNGQSPISYWSIFLLVQSFVGRIAFFSRRRSFCLGWLRLSGVTLQCKFDWLRSRSSKCLGQTHDLSSHTMPKACLLPAVLCGLGPKRCCGNCATRPLLSGVALHIVSPPLLSFPLLSFPLSFTTPSSRCGPASAPTPTLLLL